MRDQYDGSRIPTRYSPLGVILLTVLLLSTIALAVTVKTRTGGFDSCEQAHRTPGVTLPLTPADPGWNPALDADRDGQAC